MRIAMLSDGFFPFSRGGAEKIAAVLAAEYRKQGHEVLVFSSCRGAAAENTLPDGTRISLLSLDYHERWRAYLGIYHPRAVAGWSRFLSRQRPDIIHAHNLHYYLSYHCLRVAARQEIPVVMTFHDAMAVDYGKFTQGIPPAGKDDPLAACPRMDYRVRAWNTMRAYRWRWFPWRNRLIRHYLRRYPACRVSVSHELGRLLEHNGITIDEVIHNGLDPDSYQPPAAAVIDRFRNRYSLGSGPVLLLAGRLNTLKGLDHTISAWRLALRRLPALRLLLLGPVDPGLQGNFCPAGPASALVAPGWLSGEDLAAAYAVADLVAVPSLYLDPFPTVALEAMLARKPLLVSVFSGAKEAVRPGETGLVINPFHQEAYAEAIHSLLSDRARALRLGEAGFQYLKQRFSLARCAGRYLEKFSALT